MAKRSLASRVVGAPESRDLLVQAHHTLTVDSDYSKAEKLDHWCKDKSKCIEVDGGSTKREKSQALIVDSVRWGNVERTELDTTAAWVSTS